MLKKELRKILLSLSFVFVAAVSCAQYVVTGGSGSPMKATHPEKIRLDNGRETNLIRIENVKNITEYESRIDEMIERKGEWLWR